MAQVQLKKTSTKTEEAPQEAIPEVDTEHREETLNDIDDLLDEIDEVLETNAEEFVKAYVQKGGE